MESGWVAVGRLVRVRGNRGELIGEIYSSHPGREEMLKEVMLEAGERRTLARVESVWRHEGRPVFKFAGIDSISAAEPWAGADVLVAESEKIAPGEGEYSHAELIGCKVIGEAGEIGTVVDIEEYGGPPLLKIRAADGREILVPFARSICRKIDVIKKEICVDLPEGLLELD